MTGRDLAGALRRRVRGEVRFDDATRGLYATAGAIYRQVPIGVVIPRDTEDVVAAVEVCREYAVPLLPRGAGTSLAGQCANVAVVLDFTRHLDRIIEIDPDRRLARVEPGVVLDDLRAAAERHELTFGPDPSTHGYCTLGGMVGNNACGVHSLMSGRTSDNVERLSVLAYDGARLDLGPTSDDELGAAIGAGGRRGAIYAGLAALRDRYGDAIRARYPRIPRRVSGYNLDELLPENGFHVARALTGTEGTCVTVLEATLRLVPSPPRRALVALGFGDVATAADAAPALLGHAPIGLEGFDDVLIDDMRSRGLHIAEIETLPEGGGWLLVEFGADTRAEAEARASDAVASLAGRERPPTARLFEEGRATQEVWDLRESAVGATAVVPGKGMRWEGWEDSAVPPERVGDYLRDLRRLLDRHGFSGAFYGHFGEGCIHTRIDFDFGTEEGIRARRSFLEQAVDLVVSYGGSLSGEHGDGQSRAEFLEKMFGPELVEAFRSFKSIWDPAGRMNPGKVVDPHRSDDDLRLRVGGRSPRPATHFAYPDDGGSVTRATLRCVGIGKCRRLSGGTMCPSFMVTREEMHSTRGRARLLYDMLEQGPTTDDWRDESVRAALDLCLACKACKTECPANVDMATYKAEFLAHYYRGRLRPRSAYAMGLVPWWARAGSKVPELANLITGAPLLGQALKRAAGIAPERRIPRLARESFTAWFRRRGKPRSDGPGVLLWPDTFTNYFQPQIGRAAVEVLEAAGLRVSIPGRALCCGRPLYDYGMVPAARRLLARVLGELRSPLDAGTPLIGLEPSCLAVFRDELGNLFPNDPTARRLREASFTLGEFLAAHGGGLGVRELGGRAIVHAHCHQRALMGMRGEEALLSRLGLDYDLLDSGCCGMAGGFGFEAAHHAVSVAAGERVLLPRVRETPPDALVIADGFSCREQIVQETGRRALHLAEVLRMGLPVVPERHEENRRP